MRTNYSFAPNHPSLKLPNPNRNWLLQPEPNHAEKGFEMGALPPNPWDLPLSRQDILLLPASEKGRIPPPPGPSRPPSRRSGRIPALPYPPPGSHSISDETSPSINTLLNAAHNVTNHAGQFCHHSSRRHSQVILGGIGESLQ